MAEEAVESARHDTATAERARGASGRDRAAIAAVAVAALVFGWIGAGMMPLTDPDEGRYAEIAREMAASGDWIVPTLFGIPYMEKPPLLHWLTAISLGLLGKSEHAARAVPVIASALGVLLVGLFARARFSARSGVLSGLVLALSGLYVVLGRTLLVDPLFTLALAASLFAFARQREAETPSWHAPAFWLALALAVLSKGPAALAIVGVVIVADAAVERSWRTLVRPWLLVSSLVFLAVALPWFVAVEVRQPGYLSFYIWKEHLSRIAGAEHDEPLLFYVPFLLLGLLPWTLLLPALLPGGWTMLRGRSAEASRSRFLAIWAAVVFVLFSLSRGKLPTYILPMFPPLAVLIGRALDRAIEAGTTTRAASAAFATTGATFGILAVALAVVWLRVDTGVGAAVLVAAIVALACGAALVVARRNERFERPLAALVVTTAALFAMLTVASPGLARSFGAKPLIERLGAELAPTDAYLMWGEYLPSSAFYLERPPLFVGLRPELRYGASLMGTPPNVARDWPELRERTAGRRVFVLTDNRPKRVKELSLLLGDVQLIARTHTAALWLHP